MVKNLTLLVLLLSILAILPAQSYHPLLVKGRTWDELHFAPELCWTDYGVRNRFPTSDSIVGMTWVNVEYTWVMAGSPSFCPPYSVDTTTWNVAGYQLREDTAARQVFIQSPGMSPVLLYDFSLSVGDTFISSYATQGNPYVVTGITDVTLLDGTVVREFDFSPEGSYMEIVGSWQGLYGTLFQIEYPMQTKCVSQDNLPLWSSAGIGGCFDIASAAEEGTASPAVEVFPNPATDALQVHSDGSPMLLELINPQGRILLSKSLLHGEETVDVQALPAGIYLCRITSGSGNSQRRSILLL